MAKLISAKYDEGQYANQEVELPFAGLVKFDNLGNVEVPDEIAEDVVEATADSFQFYIQGAPDQENADLAVINEDIRNFEKDIKGLELKELVELAKDIPGVDIAKLPGMSNAKIRKIIIDKYKEEKLPKKPGRKTNDNGSAISNRRRRQIEQS